jgi:hypothetical protein
VRSPASLASSTGARDCRSPRLGLPTGKFFANKLRAAVAERLPGILERIGTR